MQDPKQIEVIDGTERQKQIAMLSDAIFRLLSEHFSGYCLDNEQERLCVSENLARWLIMVDKTTEYTQQITLPRARYRVGFNVVDEATGKRIINLELERDRMMTDGDFLQMQNFFWNTIGRAVADHPEVIRTLQAAGIKVTLGGDDEGSGQLAPG